MKHLLPSLPYDTAALEPIIDARTMTLHHDRHHAAYVAGLNAALEQAPGLQGRSALWLLLNPGAIPEPLRNAVHNNAGGHVNHSQLWRVMCQPLGAVPGIALAAAIDKTFGSLERFKVHFDAAGAAVFASGWVWLVLSHDYGGGLQIMTTSGHDNPLTRGHYPLLANDVWEHAYYLRHENRRNAYLRGWWPVVNWAEVDRRFEHANRSAKLDFQDEEALQAWEGEGGHLEAIH
jgi:Fe-Mn family superoxide dismutase